MMDHLPFIVGMLTLTLVWFLGWIFMAKFTAIVIFKIDIRKSALAGWFYLSVSLSLGILGAFVYYFTITSTGW